MWWWGGRVVSCLLACVGLQSGFSKNKLAAQTLVVWAVDGGFPETADGGLPQTVAGGGKVGEARTCNAIHRISPLANNFTCLSETN